MKVNINGIIVRDLERFSYNGCELSFRFSENHSYIIAEFLQLMNELFNGSCRYHYRGHLDEDIEKAEYEIQGLVFSNPTGFGQTEGFGIIRNLHINPAD